MIFMLTAPYPELEEWLVSQGHTVVNRDRAVYGRRYIDDILYPMKRLALECRADVVVIPELWGDDQIGYSKEQVLVAAQRATTVAFTKAYPWKGAGNCRARPHNVSVAVYRDEAAAVGHAKSSGRAVHFTGSFEPMMAAVTHHKQRQKYTKYRAVPWR